LRFEILRGASSLLKTGGKRLTSKGLRKAKKGPRVNDVARAALAFDRKASSHKTKRKPR